MNAQSVSFMTSTPVFSWLPLVWTVFFCAVFIAVAIRRFNRQSFSFKRDLWRNHQIIGKGV